jgi:hypothetical protein
MAVHVGVMYRYGGLGGRDVVSVGGRQTNERVVTVV